MASLEDYELPYEEYYRVPLETAHVVNQPRRAAKGVVAMGATAMRALETAADREGSVHPVRAGPRWWSHPSRVYAWSTAC